MSDFEYEIDDDNKVTITDYTGEGGDVIVPSMIDGLPVTTIGCYAFAYFTRLTSITIPASVTTIENNAFQYCLCLTRITLPKGCTIGKNAFAYCAKLAIKEDV